MEDLTPMQHANIRGSQASPWN